jgi:hypothetical protein
MATYRVPIEKQPEFDDMQPMPVDARILLKIIRPVLQFGFLFAMPPRMHRMTRTPRGNRSQPATEQDWALLPAQLHPFFDDAVRTLAALGFGEPRREITRTAATSTVHALQAFNPRTREIAIVFAAVAPRRFINTGVSFHSWWEDGARTVTNNREHPELFASLHRPALMDDLALPGLSDIRRLYDVHRRRTTASQRGRRPLGSGWEDPENNPAALLIRNGEEWEARVIESGLYYPVSATEMRLTWKGALLMSWSRLEPFESYLAWKGRRRAAAELA